MKYLLFLFVLISSVAFAQDNRYCSVGNVWTGGTSDGPAALPQACLNTSIANTPSPGAVTTVTGSLLTAYAAASCGDTLVVPHGTVQTFTFAQYKSLFPSKGCDDAHWITVRTDGTIPAEGVRVDPSYAPQMFKLLISGTKYGQLAGSDHIRFIGIEVAADPATDGGWTQDLIDMRGVNHIIWDRSYFHGTPNTENTRGLGIFGGTYIGVVDSYFSDFKCIAKTGACSDAQAILIGDTTLPEGTIAIKNNYLVGAAETILAGGSQTGQTIPSDIEIRKNTLTKPTNWNPTDDSFIGPEMYIVKNLFECKNCQRVLFEGNTLSGCWGGFTQQGWASVFSPRGSWAAVQDITYRDNLIRHVGGGWQIAATQFTPAGTTSTVDALASQRYSFHDNVIEDLDGAHYNAGGWSLQITSAFTVNAPLNNVSIHNNTIYGDRNHILAIVGSDPTNPKLPFNINITNNVLGAGSWPVVSTGGAIGGCAKADQPLSTFTNCWSNWSFTGNTVLLEDSASYQWPTGNNLVTVGASWKSEQAATH